MSFLDYSIPLFFTDLSWRKYILLDKIFKELQTAGIEASLEADKRSPQKYLIFDTLEQAKAALPVLSKYLSSTSAAAQTCGYTSIKLAEADFSYIHIKDASLQQVRSEILKDTTEYTYTCEVVTSESHSYVKITNLISGKYVCPSSSVQPFGAIHGETIIRDDMPYHYKYFKGDKTVGSDRSNPKADKSSFSIKFLATEAQVKEIEAKVAFYKEFYQPGNNEYHVIKNNCNDFANSLFSVLGYDAKPIEFIRGDYLDLHDKEVYFQYCGSYGLFDSLFYNSGAFVNLLKNNLPPINNLSNWLHKVHTELFLSYEDINAQDSHGNTPIMNALFHNNIGEAAYLFEEGADVNIPNNKGEIALHIAAKMTPSKEKIEFLEKLLAKTHDINQLDLYLDHSPLSFAVMSNDAEAIEFLVSKGANPYYINDVGDNLANIAGYSEAQDSAIALYKIDPSILHYDNLTRQYPIFNEAIQHDSFELPTHISAKDEDVLYCKIHDVAEYFAPIYV